MDKCYSNTSYEYTRSMIDLARSATAVPNAVLHVLKDILGYYNKRKVGRYTQTTARSNSVVASAPTSQRRAVHWNRPYM